MDPRPIASGDRIACRALLLGRRIDLRRWPEAETLARAPLTVNLSSGGIAVLFRYGVAVLFGVSDAEQAALRETLAPLTAEPYAEPESESLEVRVSPGQPEGLQEDALVLQRCGLEHLQLIAEALSRSLLLGHYEGRMRADFDAIEPLAQQLEREGRMRGGVREHVKRIGALLLIEHRMVGRAEVADKPELLWEHPRLERLHALLEAEFELRERFTAIDRKLNLAGRTVRTLVDLINARHNLRVEWYIVILIVVEILLTLFGVGKH